ncbi:MAG: phosphorylase [Flavobacteriaceae bacterium]|nr:phosphorylase [Flavobacteriaceae bacterium]|tara:strand:- start:143414 stop:144283 length:870 start_codon:yes stop_codon:yes gene_type:complete
MAIKPSELILNPDGSVYHLNLRPEHVATNIICVGDQYRVDKITKYFDSIEFTTQKREFKTTTGTYRNKRFSVISTGIGNDNIDIVLNELDALVNIDFETKTVKDKITKLHIVRIGTSGSLQDDIPVDSFVLSSHGLELTGTLWSYNVEALRNFELEEAFVKHMDWLKEKPYPLFIPGSQLLHDKIFSDSMYQGITATANGFYGPQGRILRLPIQEEFINEKLTNFKYDDLRISNFEMETGGIYGLSKLFGHEACSVNAIIANRAMGTFSENPGQVIEDLITYTLDKLTA